MSDENDTPGLGRRQVLRRGAMLGGALVWATPVVQSLTPAAYANGSPRPCGDISWVGVLVKTGAQFRVYKMEGKTGYSPVVITSRNGDGQKAFGRMLAYAGVTLLQATDPMPRPFTSSVGSGGNLVFTFNPLSTATVVGWMVHDGNVEGPGKNNENENAFAFGDNWALVPAGWDLPGEPGSVTLGTGAGPFTWAKPGYEIDRACA